MDRVHAAAKGIFWKEDKILFLRYVIKGKMIIDLPGGRIEYGETPTDALKREILEELDEEIEIHEPAGTYWFFREIDGDQVICLCYESRFIRTDTEIRLTKDNKHIIDHLWLSKQELIDSEHACASLKELIKNIKT
ncbi:MAG: NUDIX hydrolase [Candidatus Woesearchaeota archaeon]|nr:NUDIX hydrolase [Candidatus Woesearchaeota archaeon]